MTTEEILEAFKQDRRTPVDVNFGQIPLSPTIGRAGNYTVVQQGFIKDNAFSELSRALAQAPQLAGQFKDIQSKAGAQEVQEMDNEEIVRLVESGDTEATGFLKDWGKQRAYSRQLYDQYYRIEKDPEIEALSSSIAGMNPDELNTFLTAGGATSAMNDDELQDLLEQKYRNVSDPTITKDGKEGITLDDHMKVLHNESMRRIPLMAAKSLGAIRKKQKDYTNTQTLESLDGNISSLDDLYFDPEAPATSGELTVNAGGGMQGAGSSILPSMQNFADGKSDTVTLTGSPEYEGNEYVIPSLPVINPTTGEVEIAENVLGVVTSEGEASKTNPEGQFGVVVDEDMSEQDRAKYTEALTASDINFVRADTPDASGANEKKKEPLTPDERKEQVIKQSKLHYNQQSLALGRRVTNAMQQAQSNGSGLSEDKIKSTAFSALQTKLLYMIEQGGESMIVVDNFLDNLEANKIKMPNGKSMHQTQEGQALFINVNRAHRTRQNQMDAEEDDEESTGELKTRELLTEVRTVKVTNLSPSEKKAVKEALRDIGSRAEEARDIGEIDKQGLVEINGRIRKREEELDGNFQQDPDIDPNFSTARVMNTYGLTKAITSISSSDSAFSILHQHESDPIAVFKQEIQDDKTGKFEEYLLEEIKLITPEAKGTADHMFDKYLHALYQDNDRYSTEEIPDVSREFLSDIYAGFMQDATLAEFEKQKEAVNNRVSRRVAALKETEPTEVELGKTPEQMRAEKRAVKMRENAETTTLKEDGTLRMTEDLLEWKDTYIKKAGDTVADAETVEIMKEKNSSKKIAEFYRKAREMQFKIFQKNVPHPNKKDEFANKVDEMYVFTKKFGMPMNVIRGGFLLTEHRSPDIDHTFSGPPTSVYLNSNNRFSTLNYATEGLYNVEAIEQAAKGNKRLIEEVYKLAFNTEAKKKVVPLKTFVDLQIKLGKKQGLISSEQ